MKYLSVCSGIEAATSAWHHLGWEPVAFSEIDPFPSAVLKHHYPTVPNLGDMSKFKEWNLGAIDLLVGGTPCQSFSVAGLRKGLDDPRGNLMLTFGAIARHFSPRWLVWENVPGVLSSNGGRDFGTFLGMLGELGYGFAYRVLDAQYFGVAQRRRRVFVVGCLGNWRLAASVLFELASLSGNPPPRRETGKRTASGSAAGPQYGGSNQNTADTVTSKWAKGSGGPAGNECGLFVAQPVDVPDVMSTLLSSTAGVSRPGNAATEHETYIPMVFGVGEQPDVGHCLRSQASKADKHESTTYVAQPMAFAQNTRDEVRYINGDGQIAGALAAEAGMKQTTYVAQPINIYGGNKRKDRPDGGFYVRMDEDTTKTLDAASGLNPTCSQGGTAVLQPIPFRKSKRAQSADDDESWVDDGVANTINLFDQGDIRTTHAVVQPITHAIDYEYNAHTVDGPTGTLMKGSPSGGGHPLPAVMQPVAFSSNMSVPDCQTDVSPTLKLGGQGGNPPAIAFNGDQSEKTRSMGESLDHTPTLRADGPCHVAAPTLTASNDPSRSPQSSEITQQVGAVYHASMAVRRLTPRECERLQGFPDDHTLIPWRGKPAQACPDGPRYKALGNSMAVPVMRWIGERIRMIDELPK